MLGVHRCRRELTLRMWTYDQDRSAMTENMQVAVEVMGVEACLVILAALSSSGAEEAT